MNRLSALDAAFLYMETPQTPMHVGSVTIFTPTKPQHDLLERFRERTRLRLDLLPSYRRRLKSTPLGIDHPTWVIEDDVDLEYHIRHVALANPGTMQQLRAVIEKLHAAPLDRKKPLWEYYVIEGLPRGAFAIYVKVHHSAMDGAAGISSLEVVYDLTPGDDPAPPRGPIVRAASEPSDFLELTSTAVADFVRLGFRAVKSLPSLAKTLTTNAPRLAKDARYLLSYAKGMPRTPLNGAISGLRSYGTSTISLSEVKTLAKSRSATVNDVVLALCAGALRRYLGEHQALPKAPLVAGVPASLRPPGDTAMDNQVVFTICRLPTNLAEPLPRLAAAQASAREAKSLFADFKDLLTTDISIPGAPLIVTGFAKLMAATRAANVLPWHFNVVISNVPGPRTPLYCLGAPASHYFPVSIPYHGCALNITVQSYLDQLDFGLIACGRSVPYAQGIAEMIEEEFTILRQASEAADKPAAVETIEAKSKRARKSTAAETPPTKSARPMAIKTRATSKGLSVVPAKAGTQRRRAVRRKDGSRPSPG